MALGGAPRIAVLGGGISGLSAAFRLLELSTKRQTPLDVTLLEGGARLGGALCTIREQGFIAEAGADSFLTEKPWALDLVRRLGLDGELIGTRAEFRRTYVVRNGALVEIPEGFSLLAPTRLLPMLRSPLLSPLGKLRLMIEPLIARRRGHGDESLASFVTRRLGREVLERIAQPLAGGIYTADPNRLSLHATLPRFADMEARHGSVIRGLRAGAQAIERIPYVGRHQRRAMEPVREPWRRSRHDGRRAGAEARRDRAAQLGGGGARTRRRRRCGERPAGMARRDG